MFIHLSQDTRDTHRGRVERRIQQLRRKGWKWVKHGPTQPNSMCAVMDARVHGGDIMSYRPSRNQLPPETISMLDQFIRNWSGRKLQSIIEFNDISAYAGGAESVDDVIAVMEKFVAEL